MLDVYAKLMLVFFVIGYFLITIEHLIRVDKATIALMMGVGCWVIQFASSGSECGDLFVCLGEHISNISQIVFFLLGALGIVEIINVHKGFSVIANSLRVRSKRQLLWLSGLITFFLSAVLDNLTTTIVMISLLRKVVDKGQDRFLIGGAIVIAANAGGAWTPIGDVTTTMLWIGGQISTLEIMRSLFLPSLVSFITACVLMSIVLKGDFDPMHVHLEDRKVEPMGRFIFFLGIGCLVFVPIFKVLTGLPPFMGMLFGLSLLWIVTDLAHRNYKERQHLRVPAVLTQIDFSSLLFFLGILLAIDALDSAKILEMFAHWFDEHVGNTTVIATVIGLASAVVDNVPLVAAAMGMYNFNQYPPDHPFWQLIAYCAGTGGSILIIGSAAGVVYMGIEKVDFFWYLRNISLIALVAYFAGIVAYFLQFYII